MDGYKKHHERNVGEMQRLQIVAMVFSRTRFNHLFFKTLAVAIIDFIHCSQLHIQISTNTSLAALQKTFDPFHEHEIRKHFIRCTTSQPSNHMDLLTDTTWNYYSRWKSEVKQKKRDKSNVMAASLAMVKSTRKVARMVTEAGDTPCC